MSTTQDDRVFYDNTEKELRAVCRPEVDAIEKKLGPLARSAVSVNSSSFRITLGGRSVSTEGIVTERENAGEYFGTSGLITARATIAKMKERARSLGLQVEPKLTRRTSFSFTGPAVEISSETPNKNSK